MNVENREVDTEVLRSDSQCGKLSNKVDLVRLNARGKERMGI